MAVAVLIPCLNEAPTVERVVRDFRAALAGAAIYVYDNGSSDRTAELAASAGATVRYQPRRGKGLTVRRMFEDIDADSYLLVDGDGTYDAASAPALIDRLARGDAEMVIAARRPEGHAYAAGRSLGNAVLTGAASLVLRHRFGDLLSGYRAMSRRFVKSFDGDTRGFDLEIELAIHAVDRGFRVAEVPTPYRARPEGSFSKLSPVPDALRILYRLARSRLR